MRETRWAGYHPPVIKHGLDPSNGGFPGIEQGFVKRIACGEATGQVGYGNAERRVFSA